MKPCPPNQRPIAWLALGALEEPDAGRLRSHLEHCPACRRYWEELSSVCREHADAARALPDAHAGEQFHRRLQRRLEADAARSVWRTLLELVGRAAAARRVPFAAAATALVLGGIGLVWMMDRDQPARDTRIKLTSPAPVSPAVAPLGQAASRPPTLGTYRMIANRSPEDLDELLSRQALGDASAPSSGKRSLVFSALRRSDAEN